MMKSSFLAAAMAAICLSLASVVSAESPYAIPFTVSGYSGAPLTNFPVLVRLENNSPTGFSYADCAQGGADICFKDGAGNEIPREIDTWNTSGESLVWVCLPTVTNSATFTMRYGDTSATAQPACQTDGSVWGGAGYYGVWHMNEASAKDSTANDLDGTAHSSVTAIDAKLGKGANFPFDASSSTGIKTTNTINSAFASAISFETWACPYVVSEERALFGKEALATFKVKGGTTWFTTPGRMDFKRVDAPLVADTWYHLVVTYVPNRSAKVYVNGQLVKEQSDSEKPGFNNLGLSCPVMLGNNQWSQYYKGILDESRLATKELSADWIAASYATQHATDFLTAGPLVRGAAPVLANATATTAHTNAQLSIRLASVGDGATSAMVTFAYGPEGGALSTPVVLAAAATDNRTFSASLTGLDVGAIYAYSFAATNGFGLGTVQTGTFTAGAGYLNPARFSYNVKFTVTGYAGTEVLTNFPVLVRLEDNSPAAFDYFDCAADGSDIRFADAEEKLLPHEIETWDTAGESIVWVCLPVVTNGTTFTMYYRSTDPGASATGGVWTDYVAVIHGGSAIANSVAGGPAASAGSTNVTANADAGKAGGGVTKTASNSIGLNVANVAPALTTNGKYSVSGWFKRAGNGGDGGNGTFILGATRTAWSSGTGFVWLQEKGKYIDVARNNGHEFSTGSYTLPEGEWSHAAFAYDSGVALTTWFNGEQDNQKTSGLGNLVNTSGPWTFGSYANTASKDSFGGDMDELRIYDGVVSGDRIKAEYDTMADDAFLTADTSTASIKPKVSLLNAVYNAENFTGDVEFNVARAGDGYGTADVKIVWGYAPDSLIHTNDMATGFTGTGSGSFPLITDKCIVYVRALAVNGGGVSSLSGETLSFYVEENANAGIDTSSPILFGCGLQRFDGIYAVVTGSVVSAGTSLANPPTCRVRVKVGQSENTLAGWIEDRFPVGDFSLNVTNLTPATKYWYSVEAVDDAGVPCATTPASFMTLGKTLATASVSVNQRTYTLSGSIGAIGAGTTHVFVKWGDGDYREIATFDKDSATNSFSAAISVQDWEDSTAWTVVVSNRCSLVDGTPAEPHWTTTVSGIANAADTATYTWQPVNGNWNGAWSDSSHWASDKADNLGYPQTTSATASFADCTLANPVTVAVDGLFRVGNFNCFGSEASDVTFAGTNRHNCCIMGVPPTYTSAVAVVSNTRVGFRDISLERTGGHWEVMRDNANVTNVVVRFDNASTSGNNCFSLSTPYSRFEFVNGSDISCTKMSIGGTDTVLLIDDSTVTVATESFWAPADSPQSEGLRVEFRGSTPKLLVNNTGDVRLGPHGNYNSTVTWSFSVPVGGYANPPVVLRSTRNPFALANNNVAETPKYLLEVAPDSPALSKSKPLADNVLVQTGAGFYTNNMYEAIGTLPARRIAYGAFKYGIGGVPLDEGAAISTARQILVSFKGHGSATMFILR